MIQRNYSDFGGECRLQTVTCARLASLVAKKKSLQLRPCESKVRFGGRGFLAGPHPFLVVTDRARRGPRVDLSIKDADPRRWVAEAGVVTLRGEISVPIDVPPGKWQLLIQLADPSPSLRDDGRYAIRLANEDIEFIEATGWNILADDVVID